MSYQEYPKWIKVKSEDVLVLNAEDEAQMTGKSKSSIEKDVAQNISEGETAQAESDEKEIDAIESKGTAVTEADIVKLTEAARKEGEKRKPGRPPKA